MPDMQPEDRSPAGAGDAQRDEAQAGMPAGAPLHDARARQFPYNPFLYVCEDGRWYLNRAKRRSRADVAQDLGDAKW